MFRMNGSGIEHGYLAISQQVCIGAGAGHQACIAGNDRASAGTHFPAHGCTNSGYAPESCLLACRSATICADMQSMTSSHFDTVAMSRRAATLGGMSKLAECQATRRPASSGTQLSRPDAEQSQRFLAEALALLLADLLRSVLSDASPALPADESAVERYRNLADSLADGEIAAPHQSRASPARVSPSAASPGSSCCSHRRRTHQAVHQCANSSTPWGCSPRCSTASPPHARAARGSRGCSRMTGVSTPAPARPPPL